MLHVVMKVEVSRNCHENNRILLEDEEGEVLFLGLPPTFGGTKDVSRGILVRRGVLGGNRRRVRMGG